MAAPGQVVWYGPQVTAKITTALRSALSSGAAFGHAVWDYVAPIGSDSRTSGDLRRSYSSSITVNSTNLVLTIGANTRYAIYVELGTSKMGPRAPLRATAGEIVAILPSYFRNELRT